MHMCIDLHHKQNSVYQPFLEVKKDLSQATSSTNHVQVDGSQEGKVDFDDILSEENWCFNLYYFLYKLL